MVERAVIFVIQYAGYLLAAGFLVYLLHKRQLRRLKGIAAYLISLIAIDGIARPYVLYRYGLNSSQYQYFYWTTDLVLVLCAFLVVCDFFRRATTHKQEMWHYIRWVLGFVLILTMGISVLTLVKNYTHLFGSYFIIEFSQNLYFACLVLTTLLYIMMQQIESTDEELQLLVCGMGIEFAGPAASMALVYLVAGAGEGFVREVASFLLIPACNLGMLMTWFYGVAQSSKQKAASKPSVGTDSELAPAVAD